MSWNDVLRTILETVFYLLVAVGIPYVLSLLKKRFTSAEAQKWIDHAGEIVTDCVKATNQILVDALKQEGKFDAEAARKAFESCKEQVLALLNEKTKQAIIEACGDIETWLQAKIEAAVREHKIYSGELVEQTVEVEQSVEITE